MPINANIAMGVEPVKFDSPINTMAQLSQIQNAQNQNALAQYSLSKAQREDQIANAMSDAYKQSFDPNTGKLNEGKFYGLVASAGAGSQIPDIQKKFALTAQEQAKAQKEQGDLEALHIKILRDSLPGVNDQQSYDAWRQEAIRRVPQYANMIPPEFSPQAKQGLMLTADKALERHFVSQNLGGGEQVLAMPKYGTGPAAVVPGSAFTKTATPGELLAHQDRMARLQEETASGALSPETTDFLAQTLIQGGQLPPLGMGQKAALMRKQVLDRAAELSTNQGQTAAQAAANVIGAKSDVNAQKKTIADFAGNSQTSQSLKAANTAVDHIDTLRELATHLSNGQNQLFNTTINKFAKATGNSNITNFDAASQLVANEVGAAIIKTGGTRADRAEFEAQLSNAKSPEQIAGVLTTYEKLLTGRLNSLEQQYSTTGRKDFREKYLTDRTRQVMNNMQPKDQSGQNVSASKTIPVGTVDGGYRFKGGNPADPSSWEKQ